MRRHIFYILFIGCLLARGQIQAQEVASYLAVAGNQAVIYTGKEEAKYPNYLLNHPYFETNEYRKGTLGFDGLVYPDVNLRLNEQTEELIINSPDERFNIIVPTNRVDFANIGSYYIFFHKQNTADALPEGYYVRLHDGKFPVLQRETAYLNSLARDMTIESFFMKTTRFYIYKDGKYNQVKNKRAVLKLFKPKKKELKRLIKQHELNFKDTPADAIASTVKLYESLE